MNSQINFMSYEAPDFVAKISQGHAKGTRVDNDFECVVGVEPSLTIINEYRTMIQDAQRDALCDPLYTALALALSTNMAWSQIAFNDLFIQAYAAQPRGKATSPLFPVLRDTGVGYGALGRSVPLVALHKVTGIPLPALMVGICEGDIRMQFPASSSARPYVGVHVRDALLLSGHVF